MGKGYVDAIIVNTRERAPGQMLGMGDVGGAAQSLANVLTGGDYAELSASIEQIPFLLKVSIACSIASGALALVGLLERFSRR